MFHVMLRCDFLELYSLQSREEHERVQDVGDGITTAQFFDLFFPTGPKPSSGSSDQVVPDKAALRAPGAVGGQP